MKLRNTSVQPSERSGTAAQLKGKLQHAEESRRETQETNARDEVIIS